MVNPKLILLLLIVIIGVGLGAMRLMNPHKKFSTQAYWEKATLEDVAAIPEEALKPGNSNGPVLMWAATRVEDVRIIEALVKRGAAVNEADGIFLGTPLSGAASYNKSTQVIDKLLKLGADLDAKLLNNNSILAASAMYNEHTGIVDHLIARGADVYEMNDDDMDALDLAYLLENEVAIKQLEKYFDIEEG
ncbi:ankyrin repeat domain-containing protein [Marinicella rhabdoformis]|uniref:ankyrin repeat domain-containing protein n=1 Tax=Marinicella rhabdoformis TaxID=2580566 RepID=UPI0012AED7D0|nr:ankyrin repeat domain-containing protein [Marinicella rhabdoformis]